jgi:hypothetical protein
MNSRKSRSCDTGPECRVHVAEFHRLAELQRRVVPEAGAHSADHRKCSPSQIRYEAGGPCATPAATRLSLETLSADYDI